MKVKELISQLRTLDQEATVVVSNNDLFTTIDAIEEDEGICDLDTWDLLGQWKDLKEMEDYYEDVLDFTSIVVLS